MTKIIIGGDICPTHYDLSKFIKGDTSIVCKELMEALSKADFKIANLETPLIKKQTPIEKSGAVFGSQPEILNLIKNLGIDFLNLSNNHILDHGNVGLQQTILSLEERDIEYSGAGMNLTEASKPFEFSLKDKKIAILSYAEHEFSIAEKDKAGANPLDIIDFVNQIQKLKDEKDFIILLYHGGKEHYKLPSPKQQKLCRFFIEQGVNLITCQHSHTGGAYETHKGGEIFYGQGNFIFDAQPIKKDWLYKGFLIDIELKDDNSFLTSLIPIIHRSFDGEKNGIRKMRPSEKTVYLSEFDKMNKKMKQDSKFIDREWEKQSISLKDTYFSILNGNGRLLRKINEKTGLLNLLYFGKRRSVVKNIISCETHREIILTILKNK